MRRQPCACVLCGRWTCDGSERRAAESQELRRHNSKCPVCRSHVEQMLHISHLERSKAGAAAAGAGAAAGGPAGPAGPPLKRSSVEAAERR